MRNQKQLIAVFLIAIFAGFAGGILSILVRAHYNETHSSIDVLRAQQFEVVSKNGIVRARLGADGGELPYLSLFAANGAERLWIGLDNVDEPIIIMRDSKQTIRAVFGHETSDTASVQDDDWSAVFQIAGDDVRIAGLGMYRSYPSRKFKGFVGVREEHGNWHSLDGK